MKQKEASSVLINIVFRRLGGNDAPHGYPAVSKVLREIVEEFSDTCALHEAGMRQAMVARPIAVRIFDIYKLPYKRLPSDRILAPAHSLSVLDKAVALSNYVNLSSPEVARRLNGDVELLTEVDAARRLGASPGDIRKMIKLGRDK
jgi:hypothetical protein